MILARVSVAVVALGVSTSAGTPETVSPGLALEGEVIAGRERLVHGTVVVEFRSAQGGRLESGAESLPGRYQIEFDHDKIRTVIEHERTTRIRTRDVVISAEPRRIDLLSAERASPANTDDVFHPALLGAVLMNVQALDNCTLRECFGFNDRRNETIVDADLNGLKVKHIQYDRVVGSKIELWIQAGDDPVVVKAIASSEAGRDVMESEYKRYPPDVLYPSSVRFTQYDDRGNVVYDEECTVLEADFSRTPSQERFELASLGLKVGEVVHHNGVAKLWTGTELQEPGRAVAMEHRPPVAAPFFQRWLWLANGIVLAVIAILVLRRNLWRKP